VFPPLAVRVTLPQAVVVPEMEAVGIVFTVTTCEAVAVHPVDEVTVTVYVPLVEKVLPALVVAFPPLHRYVPPPVAVSVTLPQPVLLPIMVIAGES
jgi:hypothetical protein